MTTKTTKVCAGFYEVTDGDLVVTVRSFSKTEGAGFNGWVAQAGWDRYLTSDPIPTKGDAVADAVSMIARHKAGEI